MAQISLRLDDDLLADLELEANERGLTRSEYIRSLLTDRPATGRVDAADLQAVARKLRECERERDALDARREELRRQLTAVNSRQEEHQELVEYGERERSLMERREAREQASVFHRFKW